MSQQVVSFDLRDNAVADISRGWRFPRLSVVTANGSHEVEFVHTADGDREKSIAFLRSLSEQALRMAGELAGLSPREGHHAGG
jgi:hypothetical protein